MFSVDLLIQCLPNYSVGSRLLIIALLWTGAWIDYRTLRIPNPLVVAVIGAGSGAQFFTEGLEGLFFGLQGLGVAFALLFPLYLIGHLGAGDVKLLSAVSIVLGPAAVPGALLVTLICSGAIALIWVVAACWSRGAAWPWRRYGRMFASVRSTGHFSYVPPEADEVVNEQLPMAIPIASAMTIILLWPLSSS